MLYIELQRAIHHMEVNLNNLESDWGSWHRFDFDTFDGRILEEMYTPFGGSRL